MTDHFALLDEARRPWLDRDALKAKFLRLTSETHPDRFHEGTATEKEAKHRHFSDLNAAYECLRQTKERLAHLLELETGHKPQFIRHVPDDLMEKFVEIGKFFRELDRIIEAKNAATSPLLRVQHLRRGLERMPEIDRLEEQLARQLASSDDELKRLNAAWEGLEPNRDRAGKSALLARLEEICAGTAFLSRWQGQLLERKLQLSL